jgi:hypothetical protein
MGDVVSEPFDFPSSPTIGQEYISPIGHGYVFDGQAWQVGFFNDQDLTLRTLGSVLLQVRVLLQDTDFASGPPRYSTPSLVAALNQGLVEMFRIRPDIFLENNFKVPQFTSTLLNDSLVIEQQFIPALVYYTVGLAQLRDDEATQDARASAFLAKFSSMLAGLA